MRAQVHSVAGPGVEVVLHGDAATDAAAGADGPVLLEGASAVDGGLVVARRHVDVVGAAVGVDGAAVRGAAAGVVRAVRLNHVVLDEGVARPAVDCKVAVAAGVEGATVVDGSTACVSTALYHSGVWRILPAVAWVPTLASNKVARVAPSHGVLAASAHGVLGVAATVGPPRVEVAVVVTLAVGCHLAGLEGARGVAVVLDLVEEVERTAHDAGDGRQGKEEGLESNHDVLLSKTNLGKLFAAG